LGFTPEGKRVLSWARQIISDYESLKQDLTGTAAGLDGTLRVGAIPATLASLPLLISAFCARHPTVTVQIHSMTSIAIQRGLDDFDIDAGVTYLDNEPLSHVRRIELYRERYVFVTSADSFAGRRTITWAEAAAEPLCLLDREMQNRRIIDHIFGDQGLVCRPSITTNSYLSILTLVLQGAWSSIVPHTHVEALGIADGLHAIPLVNPVCTHAMGLVVPDRDPLTPMASALLRCAQELDLEFAPPEPVEV
jgi:DNA-binding transcriptional LysR family regulator